MGFGDGEKGLVDMRIAETEDFKDESFIVCVGGGGEGNGGKTVEGD